MDTSTAATASPRTTGELVACEGARQVVVLEGLVLGLFLLLIL